MSAPVFGRQRRPGGTPSEEGAVSDREASRRWPPAPMSVAAVVALAAGIVVGIQLVSGHVWTSCDNVRDSTASISMRLRDPSVDQIETIGQFAQITDQHPSCFADEHRQALSDLIEHGPPEIGILARPRTGEDDAHGIRPPTELLLSEARFARSTQHGTFYVIPQQLDGRPRDVCLYLDAGDGGNSLSCYLPVVESAMGHQPYPVVLTLSSGLDGLAGIVGDGVNHVLVDGVQTPVYDNVFVAESAPANAEVQVP